jgi:hypothetical protein
MGAAGAAVKKRTRLEIGKAMRRELIRRVQAGEIDYARRVTHSRTAAVLQYEGTAIAVLYSRASKSILSILPLEAPELAGWSCSTGRQADAQQACELVRDG